MEKVGWGGLGTYLVIKSPGGTKTRRMMCLTLSLDKCFYVLRPHNVIHTISKMYLQSSHTFQRARKKKFPTARPPSQIFDKIFAQFLTRACRPKIRFCRFYRDDQIQFCRFDGDEQIQFYISMGTIKYRFADSMGTKRSFTDLLFQIELFKFRLKNVRMFFFTMGLSPDRNFTQNPKLRSKIARPLTRRPNTRRTHGWKQF